MHIFVVDVTNLEKVSEKDYLKLTTIYSSANKILSSRLGQYFWCLEDILYAN